MSPDQNENFAVKVHFERVLETIASRIYDNQYAFLRENVQNAIDAIRIQAIRDSKPTNDLEYRIDISIKGNICSIQDNGIGMTKEELERHFWTMGASGKTTEEARAAGCIGVFGIGGFANFGVCDTLEVISRSQQCKMAHHTSLSRAAFSKDQFTLPQVQYKKSSELTARGTIVRGTAKQSFDAKGLANYLRQFVRYVDEPIYLDGELLSQETMDAPTGTYRVLNQNISAKAHDMSVKFQLLADDAHTLSIRIQSLKIGDHEYRCTCYCRLVHGQLDVYKRGFRLCAVNIPSRIGVSGAFDSDILQPTAGRDSLDARSQTLLTHLFQIIESSVTPYILLDPELIESHIRLLPTFVASGYLERLGVLPLSTIDGESITLDQLRTLSKTGSRIFYTRSGQSTSATEVLQARGHRIVKLSANSQRRTVEIQYLDKFCKGEEFDNLIECVDPYVDLNLFDRAVLAELDFAIRRLFNPKPYKLIPGKLSLDAPIYWSNKQEHGATVVLVDSRHGEFQKLKPLANSPLFWSMIEAFCREYLGDTLKRQSPKFFGSGAIDLDEYSKSHAELWELLSSEIEVSRISAPKPPAEHHRGSRIVVVRSSDVTRVTISTESGVTTEGQREGTPDSEPGKLLQIIDETGVTGLEGYYLRIPEAATVAFGDLIKTFPSFAIVWFANKITWQWSDLKNMAFLFDVILDRLIGGTSPEEVGHGTQDLGTTRIQTYKNQIYFYIIPQLQDHLIPKSDSHPVKIEIRHQLLDLDKSRSWTSKEKKT